MACNTDDIEGKHIHHLCNNKCCVNPSHLQSLTLIEHLKVTPEYPGYQAITTGICKNGHDRRIEAIRLKNGNMRCRACHRMWEKERHRRKRELRTSTAA
jgi:hypothetical protein